MKTLNEFLQTKHISNEKYGQPVKIEDLKENDYIYNGWTIRGKQLRCLCILAEDYKNNKSFYCKVLIDGSNRTRYRDENTKWTECPTTHIWPKHELRYCTKEECDLLNKIVKTNNIKL